jgi:hypothetical protein
MNGAKNGISELDCYDIILNYFQNNTDSASEREVWKNKAYLKLVELWKNGKINTHNTRNLFLLLLNLFEELPPDIYNSLGKPLKEKEKSENKRKFKQILKRELSS